MADSSSESSKSVAGTVTFNEALALMIVSNDDLLRVLEEMDSHPYIRDLIQANRSSVRLVNETRPRA